jgi:hypothetical protein
MIVRNITGEAGETEGRHTHDGPHHQIARH